MAHLHYHHCCWNLNHNIEQGEGDTYGYSVHRAHDWRREDDWNIDDEGDDDDDSVVEADGGNMGDENDLDNVVQGNDGDWMRFVAYQGENDWYYY